jgi:predicted MFS family arabinose efflux permease
MIEASSVIMYPPPPDADLSDAETLREFIRSRPTNALIMVLCAYAAGCLAGAFAAARLTDEDPRQAAMVVGVLLMVAGIVTIIQRPYPLWFSVTTIFLYMPSAWLGGRIARMWPRRRT